MKKYSFKYWLYMFIFAVAVITVYKTYDNFTNVWAWFLNFIKLLLPFTVGFIIAFFLHPATVKLEAWLSKSKRLSKKSKSISIFTVFFSFVILLILAISFVIPYLSQTIAQFMSILPDYITKLSRFLNNLKASGGLFERIDIDKIINVDNVLAFLGNIFPSEMGQYVDGVKGIASIVLSVITGIVVSVYMLFERQSLFSVIKRMLSLFIKDNTLNSICSYVKQISEIFYKFFFGKMIDSFIIGIIAFVGFKIIRTPYAPLMAFLIMIFNMIPYFGPIIGAIPVILVAFLVNGIYSAIWCLIFILALQQFDGIILGPKILGESVGVSPFWVIFAIIVFGGFFGIMGMIIGVPLIAAIRMLMIDFFNERDNKKLQGEQNK